MLTKIGQIQPIDKSLIPNASGLDPKFLKQAYDPDNKYSLPFANRKAGGNHIDYLIMEEGRTFAMNFFLKPETNLEFANAVLAGPVLLATKAALLKDLSSNAALFPSDATMKRLESIHDVGEATRLFDRACTELKTK